MEIEVLLATYNGERFLCDQIDSILAQDYPRLRIVARDDGSTDGTREILNEYVRRFPGRVQILAADRRTGSAKENFLILMKAATADYICFSDQDDVWLPGKVSQTKAAMTDLEGRWGTLMPLLVFTDLKVVDEQLRPLQESFWRFSKIDPDDIHRLARLQLHCVVTGCTAMVNRPLLELALRMPDEAVMHDRWMGLLAATMGRSAAVKTQTVLYRQHDRNVIGAGTSSAQAGIDGQVRSIWERRRHYNEGATALRWRIALQQASALLRVHGFELSTRDRKMLRAFLRCESADSRFLRIFTFLRYGFYAHDIPSNLVMILLLCMIGKDHGKPNGPYRLT